MQKAVLAAMARLKRDIETADQDEVEELANRLREDVEVIAQAECGNARITDLQESDRIVREGRRGCSRRG